MNNSYTSNNHEKTLYYLNKVKKTGYLIGLDIDTLCIQFVSENINNLLENKYDLSEIIGAKLEYIFQFNLDFELLNTLAEGEYEKKFVFSNGCKFFLIYYLYQDYYYIELEEDNNTNSQFYTENFTERIIFSKTKEDNWQNLVHSVQKITNYDRVMIYRIKDDSSFQSIADSSETQYFDNPYIFDQLINKKDLFIFQKKRNIYLSSLEQVDQHIISNQEKCIDLHFSELNLVNEMYINELKKSGYSSFFSIPIIVNHKIWGLLISVNKDSKAIPLSKRLQCVRLTRFARVSYVNFKYEEKTKLRYRFNYLLNSIKENLLIENDYEKISENLPGMLSFTGASGIAFVNESIVSSYGKVPSKEEILAIKKWASNEDLKDIYFSDSFYSDYGLELEITPASYGISCKIIDSTKKNFIIWFKPLEESAYNSNKLLSESMFYDIKDYSTSTKKIVARKELKGQKIAAWKKKEIKIIHDIVHLIGKTIQAKSFKISELQNQLQEVNQELNSFSHSISHDLRTPLAVMRLNCQLLQKSLESQNLNYDRIDNVIAEIDNVTEMMQEILNLSKVKNSELILEELDCSKLLDKIIKESIIYNNVGHIEIVLGILHPIFCDKIMAYEIFSNMINNAVKYSSKAEKPKIEISSAILNNQVVYKFKDNGIGIKESDREKMFKLFSRMSNSSSFKGTGIGLSIVHRMMSRIEGSIDYTSEENIGTEFILKFNLPK